MSRPLSLVFDLDDTLYLERDYIRSGFDAVGVWLSDTVGLKTFSTIAWKLFEKGHPENIFALALQESGYQIDEPLIGRMVEIYRTHPPQISLPPDAVRCLSHFQGKV